MVLRFERVKQLLVGIDKEKLDFSDKLDMSGGGPKKYSDDIVSPSFKFDIKLI